MVDSQSTILKESYPIPQQQQYQLGTYDIEEVVACCW